MSDDLTSAVAKHDRYFSRVIDMIPADLYKHTVSEDADGAQEGKYAKNRKLPLTAEERKTVSKAKKNEKYAAIPTANITSSSSAADDMEVDDAEEPASSIVASSGNSGDLESLRERLQARIMGLKAQRVSNKTGNKVKGSKAEQPAATSATAAVASAPVVNKDNKQNSGNNNKAKSTNQESEQAAKRVRRVGTAVNDASDVSIVSLNSTSSGTDFFSDLGDNSMVSATSSKAKTAKSDNPDLQFNLIAQSTVLGAAAGEGEGAPNHGKAKGTKLQRLQRLLQEAEKKRARMKQLTAHGGEEGLNRLQGEKWNDALKSARGERTLVVGSSSIEGSEGKIKNALKKREKKKAKSAEAWADRLASVKDAEALKIQKREGNIHQRRMKMKGIEVEAPTEAVPVGTGTDKQPIGAGSGRKRLYHVLKYGNSDENGHGESGEGKGGKGGHGGGKPLKSGGGGGHSGGAGGKGGNRAGFEGKKKVGEYLNK